MPPDTFVTLDLDEVFNRNPEYSLLEFLYSKFCRDYLQLHALVRLEFTDIYTQAKVHVTLTREPLINELEAPETLN